MKKLLLIIIFAVTLPLAGEEAPSVLTITPSHIAFAAHSSNTPELIKTWPQNPLARLWADPEIASFFAPLRENMEIDLWNEEVIEETGYDIDEILAFFAGESILYIPAEKDLFTDTGDQDDDEDEFPIVLLAEIGDRAEQLSDLLIRQEEKEDQESEAENPIERELREFRGVELHIDKTITADGFREGFTWAIIDDFFALASKPKYVEDLVVNSQEDSAHEALADNEEFRVVQRKTGTYDVLLYADINFLQTTFRQELIREHEVTPTPQLVSTEAILHAIGLDNLRTGFAALTIDAGAIDLIGGTTFTENRGLVAVLAFPSGAISQPDWIPATATTFGASHFDFAASWTAIVGIIDAFNPAFRALAEAQMAAMSEKAGVELDLRRDVLLNLGHNVVVVQTPVAEMSAENTSGILAPSQVFAIEIVQHEPFEMAIESLKTIAAQGSELFETRDYIGTTIFKLKTSASGDAQVASTHDDFSYALTKNYLLLGIGDSSSLEAVLVAMQKPGISAWDRAEAKSALSGLPTGADAVEYQDLPVSMLAAFNNLATISGVAGDDDVWVDPAAMPSQETIAKYLATGITAAYKDDDSITIRLRILQKGNPKMISDQHDE